MSSAEADGFDFASQRRSSSRSGRVREVSSSALRAARASSPAEALESAVDSFFRAAETGEVIAVERWLEGRERVHLKNAVDEHQRSAAHLAAREGHMEVLRLLHGHGANLEGRDRFQRTPLHLACEAGRRDATETLLDCGCQPARKDNHGRTALHLAACAEDASICETLAARLPHLVEDPDKHKRTPFFYAAMNVHPPSQVRATSVLMSHQAQVNARDSYGRTPLHYAAQENRRDAVRLLLTCGANPSIVDAVGGKKPSELCANEAIRTDINRALAAFEVSVGTAAASSSAGIQLPPQPSSPPQFASQHGHQHQPPRPLSAIPAAPPPKTWPAQALVPAGAEAVPISESRIPGALGAPFQALQWRFVEIMKRVQEGGLQQMEHIKRPHLFTASWMLDVSSHQQLLGQTLKYIPGPEVCMRIFNLLRPPAGFPEAKGDERDILAYYTKEEVKNWGGLDPYTTAGCEAEDDTWLHAGRVELLRSVHEQRRQLEAKDNLVEELRRKADKFEAELAKGMKSAQVDEVREQIYKLKEDSAKKDEVLIGVKAQVLSLEGQIEVFIAQLREEKEKNTELIMRESGVQRRLSTELAKHSQDKSWHVVLEQERDQFSLLKRQLEQRVKESNDECRIAVVEASKLKEEMLALKEESQRLSHELARSKESMSDGRRNNEAEVARLRDALEDSKGRERQIFQELGRATTSAENAIQRSRILETSFEHLRREENARREKTDAIISNLRANEARLEERIASLEREIATLHTSLKTADAIVDRQMESQGLCQILELMVPGISEAAEKAKLDGAVSPKFTTGAYTMDFHSAAGMDTSTTAVLPPLQGTAPENAVASTVPELPVPSVHKFAADGRSSPDLNAAPPEVLAKNPSTEDHPLKRGSPLTHLIESDARVKIAVQHPLAKTPPLEQVLAEPLPAKAAANPLVRGRHLVNVLSTDTHAAAIVAQPPAPDTATAPIETSNTGVKSAGPQAVSPADDKAVAKHPQNPATPEAPGTRPAMTVTQPTPGSDTQSPLRPPLQRSKKLSDAPGQGTSPSPLTVAEPQITSVAPPSEIPGPGQPISLTPLNPLPTGPDHERPLLQMPHGPGQGTSPSPLAVAEPQIASEASPLEVPDLGQPMALPPLNLLPTSPDHERSVTTELYADDRTLKFSETVDTELYATMQPSAGDRMSVEPSAEKSPLQETFLEKSPLHAPAVMLPPPISDIQAPGSLPPLPLPSSGGGGSELLSPRLKALSQEVEILPKATSSTDEAAPSTPTPLPSPAEGDNAATGAVKDADGQNQSLAAFQAAIKQVADDALAKYGTGIASSASPGEGDDFQQPVFPEAMSKGPPVKSPSGKALAVAGPPPKVAAPKKASDGENIGVEQPPTPNSEEKKKPVVKVEIIGADCLRNADNWQGDLSDPYCVCYLVKVGGQKIRQFATEVISDNLDPVWNHPETRLVDWEEGDDILFEVWDKDENTSDDRLGKAVLEFGTYFPDGFDGRTRLEHAGKGGEMAGINLKVLVLGSRPSWLEVRSIPKESLITQGSFPKVVFPPSSGDVANFKPVVAVKVPAESKSKQLERLNQDKI